MKAIGIDVVTRGTGTGRNGDVPRGRERGDHRDIAFRHHSAFDQEPKAPFVTQGAILQKPLDLAGSCPIKGDQHDLGGGQGGRGKCKPEGRYTG